MPFPRRPSGEQPITTIRWQRRQMNLMEQTITLLRCEIESKTALARELDERLTEYQCSVLKLILVENEYAGFRAQSAERAERLAYLEGYHAKSTESLPRIPAETHGRSGPGNQGDLPDGAQD